MGITIKRWVYTALGTTFLFIGVIGAVVPILPTTPFVLLASACFVRGNPALYKKLNQHPTFGPIVQNWQQNRCIERSVKKKAFVFIVASFTVSIIVAPLIWVKMLLAGLFLVLIIWFRSIPTHVDIAPPTENH
ncbi:YbaN family protein [Vibrio sp. qd031]|uniref:YbaN family protein n=1 Tax=Vibrio sp. qd031 TaxID=1603038 RepID=UPI000A0F8A2C|nr:YbaN family protein [Vibrio sp. qd031]